MQEIQEEYTSTNIFTFCIKFCKFMTVINILNIKIIINDFQY